MVVGCGGTAQEVALSGKITPPPGKLKFTDADQVQLAFIPEDKKIQSTSADVQKDLSFNVPKIPPGNYRVAITVQPYPGQPGSEQRTMMFEEFNKNYTPENSALKFEVTKEPPQQNITIDLAKGAVVKN